MDINETPKDRFKRLAEKRTNAVLEKLRLIGNLASNNYEYDEFEVNKIFNAIDEQLKAIKAKFRANRKKEFKL